MHVTNFFVWASQWNKSTLSIELVTWDVVCILVWYCYFMQLSMYSEFMCVLNIRRFNFCSLASATKNSHIGNGIGWVTFVLHTWVQSYTYIWQWQLLRWWWHVYKAIWEAAVWEELECRQVRSNRVDRYAVPVVRRRWSVMYRGRFHRCTHCF